MTVAGTSKQQSASSSSSTSTRTLADIHHQQRSETNHDAQATKAPPSWPFHCVGYLCRPFLAPLPAPRNIPSGFRRLGASQLLAVVPLQLEPSPARHPDSFVPSATGNFQGKILTS